MQTQPFADLVDESLDEAQFLWGRWENELTSLTRNLDAIVSWTEDRLQGALDGVRVAPGNLLETTLTQALASDELSRIAVAAHLLATVNTPNARAILSDAVRQATGAKAAACVRGIELADLDGSFAPITAALLKTGPAQLATLCRLKAFRRATLGQELVDTFESGIPALQAEALRAAVNLSSERVDAWINTGLNSPDPHVREAAMITGIRRRHRGAWNAAVQLTRMVHVEAIPVLSLVAMFGGAEEQRAVLAAAAEAALRKPALQALGSLATVDAVTCCLEAMSDDAFSPIAGEAYCAITGAELERDKLTAPEVSQEDAPTFEQDDLDANLVPTNDETWPKPDVQAVRRHWESRRSRYAPGVRYARGRALDIATLVDCVETAPMLRRPQYIFELAVRTQGNYDVEPRAFSDRQNRMMAAARSRVAI